MSLLRPYQYYEHLSFIFKFSFCVCLRGGMKELDNLLTITQNSGFYFLTCLNHLVGLHFVCRPRKDPLTEKRNSSMYFFRTICLFYNLLETLSSLVVDYIFSTLIALHHWSKRLSFVFSAAG